MISFAIISSFVVMNLVIAVICDALVHLNDAGKIFLLSSSESMSSVGSVDPTAATADMDPFEEERRETTLQMQTDQLLHRMEKLRLTQKELQWTLQYMVAEMQRTDCETCTGSPVNPLNEIS